jgi:hypothetical protein
VVVKFESVLEGPYPTDNSRFLSSLVRFEFLIYT